MHAKSIGTAGALLTLVITGGACGTAASIGGQMLSGLFATGPAAASGTATVDAEIKANDKQQQLLQVVTAEGRRGVVRWDVQTQVVHGNEAYSGVALEPGDQVQLRLRKTSDVDIYTDYVLIKQRTVSAGADTALTTVEGSIAALDAEKGQIQLRTAGGATVLITLPYNPPAEAAERFSKLTEGEQIRVEGRYVSAQRFELARFR